MENSTFDFAYLWNMARYGLFVQVFVVGVILVSSIPDDGGSGTCSVGDSHCDVVKDSSHQYQDLQRLVSNTTADRLIRAQTEVAKYFEIGYLAVADSPGLSGKVRMNAYGAKTQHKMTVNLMRDYMTTAKHILDDLLPIVQRTVETQDRALFVKTLERIVEIAVEMKASATAAKEEYGKLHIHIQTLLQETDSQTKKVKTEQEELKINKERNLNSKKEKEVDELQIWDELDNVKLKIRDLESEAEKLKDSINNHSWLNRGRALFGRVVELAGIFSFSYKGFTPIFKSATEVLADLMQDKESQYKEKRNEIGKQTAKKRELETQLSTIRKQKLDILDVLKRLDLKKVQIGDIKSFQMAYDNIAKTTELFDKIDGFFDKMITAIKHTIRKTESSKKMNAPEKAGDNRSDYFDPNIETEQKWWSQLGKMCMFYIKKSEREESTKISNLYKFMTYPLSMTQEERQERMTKIATDLHYALTQEISGDDYD